MANTTRIRVAIVNPGATRTKMRAEAYPGEDPTTVKDPAVVAARLLAAFRTWRTMEPGRRALADAALQRVKAVHGLSADVRDIVERSLA